MPVAEVEPPLFDELTVTVAVATAVPQVRV
jgi:hypothetical protein